MPKPSQQDQKSNQSPAEGTQSTSKEQKGSKEECTVTMETVSEYTYRSVPTGIGKGKQPIFPEDEDGTSYYGGYGKCYNCGMYGMVKQFVSRGFSKQISDYLLICAVARALC